jgi:glyoxylase-like metal-dependent hydrolase (beta-lactamase superfamily II)
MFRSKPALILLAVGLGVTTAYAQRGQGPPPLIRENATEKVSEHVYVIPDNNVGMVPNVGIIVGSRGTFIVDTGMGARNAQTIMREVAKVSKTPDLYLATTHIHPEHDLGAHGFPAQAKMIRSQDQIKEIAATGLQTAKVFSGFSPLNAELLQGADFRKADITYEKEHTVDLGGVRVRTIAMGNNHTVGDQAFFVEPDGILFSGDVAMIALPGVNQQASIATWLQSQDRFLALQPKRVVPSHGAMGGLEIVNNYKEFLTTVRTRTTELKKQGKTLDETVTAVQDELQKRWPDRQRMASAIRAAYNNP